MVKLINRRKNAHRWGTTRHANLRRPINDCRSRSVIVQHLARRFANKFAFATLSAGSLSSSLWVSTSMP